LLHRFELGDLTRGRRSRVRGMRDRRMPEQPRRCRRASQARGRMRGRRGGRASRPPAPVDRRAACRASDCGARDGEVVLVPLPAALPVHAAECVLTIT
jgi:hypothetical protein